jgi:predicted GNAT family acetyltransferase
VRAVAVAIRDNPEADRYEITVDGELAGFAQYEPHGSLRTFTHTEIDDHFAGRGLATELIAAALDDVRRQDGRIVAVCPFVRAFLDEHREYGDLVEPGAGRGVSG